MLQPTMPSAMHHMKRSCVADVAIHGHLVQLYPAHTPHAYAPAVATFSGKRAQSSGTGITQGVGPFRLLVAVELWVVVSIVYHREDAAIERHDSGSRQYTG